MPTLFSSLENAYRVPYFRKELQDRNTGTEEMSNSHPDETSSATLPASRMTNEAARMFLAAQRPFQGFDMPSSSLTMCAEQMQKPTSK